MTKRDHVKRFYAAYAGDESERLAKTPYASLEHVVTSHFLDAHLPAPSKKAVVLDAGCGPGRYAVDVAKRGFDVVLFDLVPEMLAAAQAAAQAQPAAVAKRLRAFDEGSIDDLSRYADGTFDAVLCLGGPLSHVVDDKARRRAARELVRVAKPGAPVFVSVMGRLAFMRGLLTRYPHVLRHAQSQWTTGDYVPGKHGDGFTAAHWFLPDELVALFTGVDVVALAGLEGLSSHHETATNALALDKKAWRAWLDVLLTTATHPAVVATSEHFLLVLRKRRRRRR